MLFLISCIHIWPEKDPIIVPLAEGIIWFDESDGEDEIEKPTPKRQKTETV